MTPFTSLLASALERRQALLDFLRAEGTEAFRVFHGAADGEAGLTIDRYGPLSLVQTFRQPLELHRQEEIFNAVQSRFSGPVAYNHRGKRANEPFGLWHQPSPEALEEFQCREFGHRLLVRARHAGIDPWLHLDLRAGRRALRARAREKSVLNLFAYTGSVGIAAAAAGANEVWNVDFAASSLVVARRNAGLNQIPEEKFKILEGDCLPVMRSLAGLTPGGRRGKVPRIQILSPREFDLVFLDPPAWAKSPFGAVDVAGDYPSLFKPALLCTRPGGGTIFATNHVAAVEFDEWVEILERCARKAGRPLRSIERLAPEADFPSFDGKPPLKIAVCEV